MKYLVVLIVVFIGVWVWRSSNRITARKERQEGFEREAERQNTQKIIVSCAHCGLHLPQQEALAAPSADLRQQLWFCSTEHRQFGPKSPKNS